MCTVKNNWRHQLIGVERNGCLEYGVYEVAFDPKTNEITHMLTSEPITLISESKEDMIKLVKSIYRDLKNQTQVKVEEHKPDKISSFEEIVHEEEVDDDILISIYHGDNETERYAVEEMYNDRDSKDNIIDAVDFFNRRG